MDKTKLNKLLSIIIGAAVAVGAVIYVVSALNQVRPELTVNGTTLRVGMEVQELADAGFSVGISMSGSGGLDLDVQPKVPGESYSSTSYYVFKDGEYTNVSFSVYNTKVDSCEFKDSRIYEFSYRSRYNFSDTEVLVNGIDVGGMDKKDALQAFEKLGVKFDSDDKDEFLNTDYGFIIGKSGEYSYELETDDDNKVIESIRARRRV